MSDELNRAEMAQTEFVRLGLNYYVVGRFSMLNDPSVISGNLIHHAFEMLMKGELLKNHTMKDLQAASHNLLKLWDMTKAQWQVGTQSRFDNLICKLDRFERIRYPDNIVREGLSMILAIRSGDDQVHGWPEPNSNSKYQLALEDMDEWVNEFFRGSNLNPMFFLNSKKETVRSLLSEHNSHSILS